MNCREFYWNYHWNKSWNYHWNKSIHRKLGYNKLEYSTGGIEFNYFAYHVLSLFGFKDMTATSSHLRLDQKAMFQSQTNKPDEYLSDEQTQTKCV